MKQFINALRAEYSNLPAYVSWAVLSIIFIVDAVIVALVSRPLLACLLVATAGILILIALWESLT